MYSNNYNSSESVNWTPKSVELNFPTELDNILSTSDNAVVYFYKPECPYCIEFTPTYESIAGDIHRTNLTPGAVPVVMSKIDGVRWKYAINKMRPGFLGDPVNKRGYPTLLFKRSDGVAMTWDNSIPRTKNNIQNFMAAFYGDPTLQSPEVPLYQVMNNTDPEFLYFYSDNVSSPSRMSQGLDPNFVDRAAAIRDLNYFFYTNPEIASRGFAFPVNRMDHPEVRIPSVYDLRDNREYAMRDSHRWAIRELQSQNL